MCPSILWLARMKTCMSRLPDASCWKHARSFTAMEFVITELPRFSRVCVRVGHTYATREVLPSRMKNCYLSTETYIFFFHCIILSQSRETEKNFSIHLDKNRKIFSFRNFNRENFIKIFRQVPVYLK